MLTMTEDDWIDTYRPKPAPHADNGFDYGNGATLISGHQPGDAELLAATDPACIWTVLSDEEMVISAGYHHVNRLGHIITEVPAAQQDIEVEVS